MKRAGEFDRAYSYAYVLYVLYLRFSYLISITGSVNGPIHQDSAMSTSLIADIVCAFYRRPFSRSYHACLTARIKRAVNRNQENGFTDYWQYVCSHRREGLIIYYALFIEKKSSLLIEMFVLFVIATEKIIRQTKTTDNAKILHIKYRIKYYVPSW